MRLRILFLLCLPALFMIGCSDGTPPQPANMVTLTVVSSRTLQPYTPPWIAFQDRPRGSWSRVTPGSPGVYTCAVTDPAGAYGFAIPVEYPGSIEVIFIQATLADAPALTFPYYVAAAAFSREPVRILPRWQPTPGPHDWTMQGTVTGIPRPFNLYSMAMPRYTSSSYLLDTTSFPYTFILPSTWPSDCGMLLADISEPYDNGLLYLRRNLTNAPGASVDEDIDFSAPYGGVKHTYEITERATVSVTGTAFFNVDWLTANGTDFLLNMGPGSSIGYPVVPAAATVAGDRYRCYAGDSQSDVSTTAWSHAPITAMELPDPFTCGLTGRTYTGLNHPGASLYDLRIGDDSVEWYAYVTPAWLTAAGADAYTFPDLSDLDGWQSAWGFGEVTHVFAMEHEYNYGLTGFFGEWLPPYYAGLPADGAYRASAYWYPD